MSAMKMSNYWSATPIALILVPIMTTLILEGEPRSNSLDRVLYL